MSQSDKHPGPCVCCGAPMVTVKARMMCGTCYKREWIRGRVVTEKDDLREGNAAAGITFQATHAYRYLLSPETLQRLEEFELRKGRGSKQKQANTQ